MAATRSLLLEIIQTKDTVGQQNLKQLAADQPTTHCLGTYDDRLPLPTGQPFVSQSTIVCRL